ncbi:unnamed protein product [Prunus armeniaca]
MWVRRHPLLLLVFSSKLEEERMGMGASQKVISTWVCLVLMVLTDMLDIFHDAGLGWATGILFLAACEFTEAIGNSLFDQAIGYFPKLLGHSFSLTLTHIFGLKKWAQILVLPSSPKLPLLGPSMGLVNALNYPCHNPLNKPQAFAWFGFT